MGEGIDGRVYALATGPDGSLYAGGDFTAASGVAANRIARWDGTWHGLGTGVNGSVRAVAIWSGNSIYAGGGFTTASGVAATGIARWDSTTSSWLSLGSGGGMEGSVFALASGRTSYALRGWTLHQRRRRRSKPYRPRRDGAARNPLSNGVRDKCLRSSDGAGRLALRGRL